MSSSKIHQNYLGPYGQPDAKNIREWTKPLIPTVFPAASPGIQAYQRQSHNFVQGPAKYLPKRPAWVGPGENTLDDPTLILTGGSNQSGHDVGQTMKYRKLTS